MQFHLYLPQYGQPAAAFVELAQAAESAGFGGVALMDHLAAPLAERQPMFEAMTLAAWIAARTERLTLGHLVLCDAFRHPAQLAREVVTLDHLSGGRFEVGLGSGSVPAELRRFGVTSGDAVARLGRLGETLEVLRLLWSGESVDHAGPRFPMADAQQVPAPLNGHPPVTLGGTSPALLELVNEYADWWNVPPGALDRLEDLRPRIGSRARVSVLEMVALVPPDDDGSTADKALKRFGHLGDALVIGDAAEIRAHLTSLAARGVDRHYTWFADFAQPDTLRHFGAEVIGSSRDDAVSAVSAETVRPPMGG